MNCRRSTVLSVQPVMHPSSPTAESASAPPTLGSRCTNCLGSATSATTTVPGPSGLHDRPADRALARAGWPRRPRRPTRPVRGRSRRLPVRMPNALTLGLSKKPTHGGRWQWPAPRLPVRLRRPRRPCAEPPGPCLPAAVSRCWSNSAFAQPDRKKSTSDRHRSSSQLDGWRYSDVQPRAVGVEIAGRIREVQEVAPLAHVGLDVQAKGIAPHRG